MARPQSKIRLSVAWLIACVSLSGCGNSTDDLLTQARQKATAAATAVGQATKDVSVQVASDISGSTASSIVVVDQPYEELNCFLHFRPGFSGTSILQVMNYDSDEAANENPCFLLHATVSQQSLKELVGQTIPASFFFRNERGELWYTPVGQSVQVSIESGLLQATLRLDGRLTSAQSGDVSDASGIFSGALP